MNGANTVKKTLLAIVALLCSVGFTRSVSAAVTSTASVEDITSTSVTLTPAKAMDHWKVRINAPMFGLGVVSGSGFSTLLAGTIDSGEISAIYDFNPWWGVSIGSLIGKGPNTGGLGIDLSNQNQIAPELTGQVHHEWGGWFGLRAGLGILYMIPGPTTYHMTTTTLANVGGETQYVPFTAEYDETSGGIAPLGQFALDFGPFAGLSVGLDIDLTDIVWTIDYGHGSYSINGGPSQPVDEQGDAEQIMQMVFGSFSLSYSF